MEEAKKFAEAYITILEFIGYAAGIGAAHAANGAELGKRLEERAMKAYDAALQIRPMTEAEAERKKIERWEEMAKNERIGTIMAMEK